MLIFSCKEDAHKQGGNEMRLRLVTWWIEYRVYDDMWVYSVALKAHTRRQAISQLKDMEKDLKSIVRCEILAK